MRKILVLCLMLLFICVPVWAGEAEDARDIIIFAKDLDNWHGGISKFEDKLFKFKTDYPDNLVKDEAYMLHNTVLQLMIYDKRSTKYGDVAWMEFFSDPEFRQYYPDIDYRIAKRYGWSNKNLTGALYGYGIERRNILEKAINDNYPEPPK